MELVRFLGTLTNKLSTFCIIRWSWASEVEYHDLKLVCLNVSTARSGLMMVNLHREILLRCNHLRDTALGMSVRVFLGKFN